MFPTVTLYKEGGCFSASALTSTRAAKLSRRPEDSRKFKVKLIILSEENSY